MIGGMAINSGDVIAFSGADWVADAINLVTFGLPRVSIHHVGIVSKIRNDVVIYEAIGYAGSRGPCLRSGCVAAGFQAHLLDDVLAAVSGKVFHLPLRSPLYTDEEDRLGWYLDSKIGLPYDRLGAARSGGFVFRLAQSLLRPEDTSSIFCSESMIAGLVHVGRVQTRHAGKFNPNAACRMLRRTGVVDAYRRLK